MTFENRDQGPPTGIGVSTIGMAFADYIYFKDKDMKWGN
jgi:hypothetical protein